MKLEADSRLGGPKDRSKFTWQSILGYLPVYPWINCEVSKDTFSGQFSDYMEHSPKHARRLSHRYVS